MAIETEKPTSAGQDTLRGSRSTSLSQHSEKSLPSTSHDATIDPDVEHGIPLRDTTEDEDEKPPISRVVSVTTANVVDWNDSLDIRRPINWTVKKKWTNCSIISALTFLTPLASSMAAPAVPLIMANFKSTNSTLASFIVSIYILGYAIGPLFIAPLSEMYGRMPVYHICNVMFVVWNVACALAPSLGSLLAFRLLAGIAGSCPITIFAGSIADVFIQEKRGGAMAICALGPLLGPGKLAT